MRMERRNLAAAYKFYCGRKMEDDFQAHLANEDTEATYRVLQGQLDMYEPGRQEEEERQLPNDMNALHAFCNQRKNVDFAGKIIWGPVPGPDGKPLLNADGTEVVASEGENSPFTYVWDQAFVVDATAINHILENDRNHSTAIYDLQGRRYDRIASPGLYIVNGKRTLIRQ